MSAPTAPEASAGDTAGPVAAGATRPRFRADLPMYYRREFSASLATNLAYRGAVAIWVGGSVVQPLVFIAVWRAVAGDGTTGGYTADQFVSYFLGMMIVDFLTFIWLMWDFEWRIRSGSFAPLLLRPVHPVHRDVCLVLSYKTVGLGGILAAAVLVAVGFGADLSGVGAASVACFVPVLVLAAVLRFMIEYSLALSAFWLTKVSALNAVYYSLGTFLGGFFAPLTVLPERMQTVAEWTPFPWMLAFPVEVLLGRRSGAEVVTGLAVQLVWLALALIAFRLLWRRATARFTAVGT